MDRAVVMNGAACARLMAVIAGHPEPFVTVDNVMVPTELGDVGYWLGCQAETVMARGLGWDILTIAVGGTLTGAALTDVQALKALRATIGAVSQPIEIVPVDLST